MVKYELLRQVREELNDLFENYVDRDQQNPPTDTLQDDLNIDTDNGGGGKEKIAKCSVCGVELSNPDHTLCYTHWKEKQTSGDG